MGKGPFPFLMFLSIILSLVIGCTGANPDTNAPRLIQDVTITPRTAVPTRVNPDTPTPVLGPTATGDSELVSPLEVVTIESDFVLVTPTLPPTKTPTITPTVSPTASQTPPPTFTPFPAATVQAFPTVPPATPIPAVNAAPIDQICDSSWFFIEPDPPSCPLNPPTVSQGTFQVFEYGYMVWIRDLDAIYVMYDDDQGQPRWEVFNDTFDEGMQESDELYDASPPGTWQPRRGFGKLWRERAAVRNRIGWAIIEWEVPYSIQVQTANDGSVFIEDPDGGLFNLSPNGSEWERYYGESS